MRVCRTLVTGLRLLSRPLLVSALIASEVGAQDPMRPWADWRTLTTAHYRFHFPRELEAWTRHAAERVESIDSAIAAVVGFRAERPTHVVVH